MTRDELNKALCAVITTLDEVEYATETSLYIGMGSNLTEWNTVKAVLEAGKLATIDASHAVKITPAGRAMAARINAFMQS
jgi:hypothetical protein